jgi:acyl carrier protein
MSPQSLESQVCRILAELFSLPPESVAPESSPQTIEGWDSIGHLNLVLALEQEFHVQFSPDESEKMVDVQEIVRVLNRRGVGNVA